MKDFLRDYFTFTKKERAGIIVLIIILLAGIFIPMFFTLLSPPTAKNVKAPDLIVDSFSINGYTKKNFTPKKFYSPRNLENKKVVLFFFDPNTATQSDWINLGVKAKTAATILKFISKGGHFYKPEDLSKIYGLHENDVNRLSPYVRIAASENTRKNTTYKKSSNKDENIVIDINTADSFTLMKLPGIGQGLSRRILNFRNKLGGFYAVDQIGETYGLPDSTFQKLKNNFIIHSSTKKLNINSASIEELKTHPYIRYQIANSIIQYRQQHGSFKDISDLKNIMIISEPLFEKISHYVSIN
ncbi:MAG: helix-hairpin-helix domain-containing protein [Ginsengibacter sp.]